jgi:hypothetical protein
MASIDYVDDAKCTAFAKDAGSVTTVLQQCLDYPERFGVPSEKLVMVSEGVDTHLCGASMVGNVNVCTDAPVSQSRLP